MILRTLAIAALLAPAAHAADFDRTLPVSSAADLYIATGSGSIRIHPGDDSSIHVRAHLHANGYSGGDVDGRMTSISQNPPIRQSGNTIRIGDVDPEQRRLYNNITIDYEITAPRGVALNIRSGSGDLEIDHLGRFLKAETSSGSVRAHGIAGSADLSTGSGDIELQQEAGGDVKAHTGSGSIRVNGLQGSLDANTGSGDVEANGRLTGRRTHCHRLRLRPASPRPECPLRHRRLHRFRLHPPSGSVHAPAPDASRCPSMVAAPGSRFKPAPATSRSTSACCRLLPASSSSISTAR